MIVTDTQIDREQYPPKTIDHSYVCNTVMRPNNNNNKWSKNFDASRHRSGDFSSRKFNVTLDCFCSQPIRMLVASMWGNPDVRATGNSARRHAGKSRRHPLQECPSGGGPGAPSNTQFIGHTRVHIPNGNSIIYAGFAAVIDRQTRLLHLQQ